MDKTKINEWNRLSETDSLSACREIAPLILKGRLVYEDFWFYEEHHQTRSNELISLRLQDLLGELIRACSKADFTSPYCAFIAMAFINKCKIPEIKAQVILQKLPNIFNDVLQHCLISILAGLPQLKPHYELELLSLALQRSYLDLGNMAAARLRFIDWTRDKNKILQLLNNNRPFDLYVADYLFSQTPWHESKTFLSGIKFISGFFSHGKNDILTETWTNSLCQSFSGSTDKLTETSAVLDFCNRQIVGKTTAFGLLSMVIEHKLDNPQPETLLPLLKNLYDLCGSEQTGYQEFLRICQKYLKLLPQKPNSSNLGDGIFKLISPDLLKISPHQKNAYKIAGELVTANQVSTETLGNFFAGCQSENAKQKLLAWQSCSYLAETAPAPIFWAEVIKRWPECLQQIDLHKINAVKVISDLIGIRANFMADEELSENTLPDSLIYQLDEFMKQICWNCRPEDCSPIRKLLDEHRICLGIPCGCC